MNNSEISRSVARLLALVPGWGHIYLNRTGWGLALFTLWTSSSFLFLNATWTYLGVHRGMLLALTGAISVGLFIYSVWDVFHCTAPSRVEKIRRHCEHLLWEGMMHFVRRDYMAAEKKFLECCQLDGLDVEAHFRAGVVAVRRQADAQARRLLEKARQLDGHLKWHWEIERELQSLRQTDSETEKRWRLRSGRDRGDIQRRRRRH